MSSESLADIERATLRRVALCEFGGVRGGLVTLDHMDAAEAWYVDLSLPSDGELRALIKDARTTDRTWSNLTSGHRAHGA